MDPVSRVLIEAESRHPSILPWVFLALILHVALAAGVFLINRRHPRMMAAQLPTVSVRLIQQKRPPRRSSRPAAPRPKAVPTPMPAPTAVPTAAPTAVPRVADNPPPSRDAMPTMESRKTPIPTAPPQPASGGGLSHGGLSLGGETGGQAETGVPSDFQFTYYLERMLALIESRWYEPPVPPGTSARARFTIETSGHVRGIVLESSSGNSAYDRAVLRALYAANPLPPLPPAYRKPSLTIHLNFAHRR